MTRPLPPRADRATATPERRALQDALAWPIAITLLVGAAIVFVLPRVVPPRFITLAVGAVFALVTISLVSVLSRLVERWLRRHAAALATVAEQQVQLVGVAGLPTATGDGALVPLASAYADAGARAALDSAAREVSELLARLGDDAATAIGRAAAVMHESSVQRSGSAADVFAPAHDVASVSVHDASTAHDTTTAAINAIMACTDALRRVTAVVPDPREPVDLVRVVRDAVHAAMASDDTVTVHLTLDTDRGMVLIDEARLRDHVRELLHLAREASAPGATVTVHVSRIFRTSIEEAPVRRTGDSPLTIVPRAAADALRAWVLRAQPGAEVLSVIVTDAGTPIVNDREQRAFDPFAITRPGDPLGVTLATIRRTVSAARGTIWIAGSREGGTAVHMLLPIAVT